jgi:PhzF family phenazine biosynthesis protein
MTRSIAVLQVDAFTSRPFGGNPAGVVLDADALSDDDMKRIAGEMSLAETAFVTGAGGSGTRLRLRWFTPIGREVTFCGHATVATAHALDEAGRTRGDRLVFRTLGGDLPVTLERTPGPRVLWLEPTLPSCAPYPGALPDVLAALGVTAPGAWARPAVTSAGDLLLPVSGLATLRGLEPDMRAIAAVATAERLRGICAVSLEGVEPGSRTHARFFAPHLGIPEDLVTGSVHAAIPIWLWETGALATDGDTVRFTAEQGDLLGRRGRLAIELALDGGRPAHVRVGGEAVTVLSGTMRLD